MLEYLWVLLILVALEGLLAADNALVLAIIVKKLPEHERRKALFFGLAGAFVFRFLSLFAISFLVGVWQVQALGALYLFFIAGNHLFRKVVFSTKYPRVATENMTVKAKQTSNFWGTVLKVELADIAFAVDSILAAVAFASSLPPSGLTAIGGIDGGRFMVILAGGFVGIVVMRFAATFFIKLLGKRPRLETAAFLIVGWVGVKLFAHTLSHPQLNILPEGFTELIEWKALFYFVLIFIVIWGWFSSKIVFQGETEKHK